MTGSGRACQVNAAIERALDDAAAAIEARGIIVVKSLDATHELATEDLALHQALYTIFRGLPDRLVPGATLLVGTHDRAGGDIELIWEARELATPPREDDRPPLANGPYGDLLELALAGLEEICRVRGGHHEDETTDAVGSNVLRRAPHVRRRYTFIIPSLSRAPAWAPSRATLTRS